MTVDLRIETESVRSERMGKKNSNPHLVALLTIEFSDDKAEAKTEVKEEATPEQAVNEKKRAREDDGGESEAPTKKVDTKSEVAAEAS